MRIADPTSKIFASYTLSHSREVILDCETTGLYPHEGHRVIEIACIEMFKRDYTGRTFHCFVNPEFSVSTGAYAVHGISDAFLADKPVFADIASDIYDFLDGAKLVAHNAPFDMSFLNSEFERALGIVDAFPWPVWIDTLAIARREFGRTGNKLDDLCKRFRIDTSARTKHSALVDTRLLAEVYLSLTNSRQRTFDLAVGPKIVSIRRPGARSRPLIRPAGFHAAHRAFVATLKQPIWNDYLDQKRRAA